MGVAFIEILSQDLLLHEQAMKATSQYNIATCERYFKKLGFKRLDRDIWINDLKALGTYFFFQKEDRINVQNRYHKIIELIIRLVNAFVQSQQIFLNKY